MTTKTYFIFSFMTINRVPLYLTGVNVCINYYQPCFNLDRLVQDICLDNQLRMNCNFVPFCYLLTKKKHDNIMMLIAI